MTEYAVRYGDTMVRDPSWRCIADVIATYHGGYYCDEDGRVTGELVVVDTLADERTDVLDRFMAELAKATGDGSRKRQAGTKPPWYEDDAHEAAIFSHLMKWKRGDTIDPDSGAHTLVHLAWRALAIALKETGNIPGA